MLSWNEPDLIGFFNSLPTFDEFCLAHTFEATREGLKLLVTIEELRDAVWVSLFRDSSEESLFTIRHDNCSHVLVTEDVGFRRCFEAGSPRFPVSDSRMIPQLSRGIRIYLEPDFKIVLIEDGAG